MKKPFTPQRTSADIAAIARLAAGKNLQQRNPSEFPEVPYNVVSHYNGHPLQGDFAFLGIVLMLIFFITRRFRQRKNSPPAFFILVLFALFDAVTGIILIIGGELGRIPLLWTDLGQKILSQGFILSLVLGIGSFLGPRIFGFEREASLQLHP